MDFTHLSRRLKKATKAKKKTTKSTNVYLQQIVQFYRFLAKKTQAKGNTKLYKYLMTTRVNRRPLSIREIQLLLKYQETDKVIVTPGSVVDAVLLRNLKPYKICALHFSATAKAKILKAGGQCWTFDKLAVMDPMAANIILIKGNTYRKALKYQGTPPGIQYSTTKAKIRSKGRKFEKKRSHRKNKHNSVSK